MGKVKNVDETQLRRGPGRTPSIDQELIQSAIRHVGKIQEISMHAVAKKLGVNVTTLYRHTGGLEGLRRIYAGQVSKSVGDLPSPIGSTWREWSTQLAGFYRSAFLQSPDLLRYAQAALDPDFIRLERATKILIDYGFTPKAAVRAHAFLVNNVVGYVHQELQTLQESVEGITPTYSRLSETLRMGAENLPTLSNLHLDSDDLDSDANFVFFMAYAIDGIAAHHNKLVV